MTIIFASASTEKQLRKKSQRRHKEKSVLPDSNIESSQGCRKSSKNILRIIFKSYRKALKIYIINIYTYMYLEKLSLSNNIYLLELLFAFLK